MIGSLSCECQTVTGLSHGKIIEVYDRKLSFFLDFSAHSGWIALKIPPKDPRRRAGLKYIWSYKVIMPVGRARREKRISVDVFDTSFLRISLVDFDLNFKVIFSLSFTPRSCWFFLFGSWDS